MTEESAPPRSCPFDRFTWTIWVLIGLGAIYLSLLEIFDQLPH